MKLFMKYCEGLLLGAAAGFIGGILFAPKSGAEMRRQMAVSLDDIKDLGVVVGENMNCAKEAVIEELHSMQEKASGQFHRFAVAGNEMKEEMVHKLDETKDVVSEKVEDAKEVLADKKDNAIEKMQEVQEKGSAIKKVVEEKTQEAVDESKNILQSQKIKFKPNGADNADYRRTGTDN